MRPDLGVNLAMALLKSGRDEEGLSLLARLVRKMPMNPYLHFQLVSARHDQGQLDKAMAGYRQAIALDPKLALAHNNLGLALYYDKGQVDEAIAEFPQAIALNPKQAHYRQAIWLRTGFAEAHCNLGQTLQQVGRFHEAVASLRRGHELGSKQPGWEYPSPANPGEAVLLALMCRQPYKKRYAASARLYADAFTAEPKLAANLNQQHRYNAACSAAVAAAGQGEDTHLLPDKVVFTFRRWALGWLREDLTAYAQLAERNNAARNERIQQRLTHWRRDVNLASLRDQVDLDRLPDTERAAWQSLWRDVDELAARLAKKTD